MKNRKKSRILTKKKHENLTRKIPMACRERGFTQKMIIKICIKNPPQNYTKKMQVCITFFQFSSLSWSKWVQKNCKKLAKKSWKIAKNHEFLRKKMQFCISFFHCSSLSWSKWVQKNCKKNCKKIVKNPWIFIEITWIFIKNTWLFIKIFRELSWPKLAHRATTGAQDPRYCTFS